MIKFFRRIRQQLLSENKFSKYLIYAIGEIILVVIGILIALQINNWNDKKKENQREQVLLNQLHNQFINNLHLFNNGINFYEKKLSGLNRISNFYTLPSEVSADSSVKYLNDVFTSYTYNPSNGLVESLLSSSSLEVIQNDSLKNLLVSWKDVLMDYKEEEDQIIKGIENLSHYFNLNMDFANIANPDSKLNISNIQAFSSKQFRNHVMGLTFSTSRLLNTPDREIVKKYLEEIIRLSDL